MFWDLNPDLNFTHELIEKTLNLKTCIQNKIMITREQNRLGSTIESKLDFFFSTQQFESIKKLDKFDSDHYPLISKLKISGKTAKIKKNIILRKIDINEDKIKSILTNEEWSSNIITKTNQNILQKSL